MTTVHPIAHVDIFAHDQNESANFYRDAFGWEVDSSFPGYPMFSAEGGPGGGFVKAGSEGVGSFASAGVLIYLRTSDIDASLGAITAAGGAVVAPRTEIEGGHGSYAVFSDPGGNTLGLYQPPAQE